MNVLKKKKMENVSQLFLAFFFKVQLDWFPLFRARVHWSKVIVDV